MHCGVTITKGGRMAKKKRKKPARSTRKPTKSKAKKRSKAPKKRKVRLSALTRDDGSGTGPPH
jgi:hypothetical protein